MTPEQQRIAIAEACGWNSSPTKSNGKEPMGFSSRFPEWFYPYHLPDYLNDLNAMHEAEKVLDSEQWHKYASLIGRHDYKLLLHATAAHRAEAFLRTIGKWVES